MCGIIGYLGPKPTVPLLLEGLKRLEYRGYDSAGVAVVDRGRVLIRRARGKLAALEESLRAAPLEGAYGLGHTRWATHGRPSEENAHPHVDCTGRLVVVHNGIIENYLELKASLRGRGHVFRTETDTEVVAHLLEAHFRGDLAEAMRATLAELEGAFALAAVSADDPGRIVAAKSGPPIVIGEGEGETVISSDVQAVLPHTRRVVFLEDGEMAVADGSGVRFSDFAGRPLVKPATELAWSPLTAEKRGFKHFMLKEIFEQPEVVRDTLLGRMSLDTGEVLLEETGLPAGILRGIEKAVVIACGTSYHAGLAARCWFETWAGVPAQVEFASELRYRDLLLDGRTLAVVISQSGETADTLAALRAVKDRVAAVLALTNAESSSVAREAHGVLYTHAGPEIGVAATKTFTAQLAALALTALHLGQARGALDAAGARGILGELQRLPHKMERVLGRAGEIEALAGRLASAEHVLFLGRWVSFPVALEGALKLKEISYIHADAYPGGEMKHGPIALVDERMPTLAVVPDDRVRDKMLGNISEIKARAGTVAAVATEGDAKIGAAADDVFFVPATLPLLTPFLTVIPLQLLAYHIAAKRGADVDQPRNLAKSVTVE